MRYYHSKEKPPELKKKQGKFIPKFEFATENKRGEEINDKKSRINEFN